MTERPFVLAVAELLRRPARREVEIEAELGGLAIFSASVSQTTPVRADLVLDSQPESLTVTGTVAVPWQGECRRCLRTVSGTAVAELREVFERHPVEGETYRLAGDQVDLEPAVRDAALLALPLAPLCDEVCAGPDPEDHPVVVEGDDSAGAESERAVDPRWAALDQLKFD